MRKVLLVLATVAALTVGGLVGTAQAEHGRGYGGYGGGYGGYRGGWGGHGCGHSHVYRSYRPYYGGGHHHHHHGLYHDGGLYVRGGGLGLYFGF